MTLRPPTLCLLAVLSLAAPAAAQVAPAPTAVPPAVPDAAADADVEFTHFRIAYDAEGTETADVSGTVRVLTPAGVQQMGTVTIPFRKGGGATLRVDYVRVRKPDGAVVDTPLAPVFELPAPVTQIAPTYSDFYVRHINVQALQPGDVLEYSWQVIDRSLIPGHFWHRTEIDGKLSAKRHVLELSWPSTVRPIVKSPNHEPEITNAGGRTTYRWTSSRVDAPADEDDEEAQTPDVQVTSFRDWAEVGAAVRELWRSRADVTPDVRARALELTAGLKTDDEKARALYRHVATNFRYVAVAVGLGRIQPNAASTVLANGFGDCKDKHVLLEALLRAVNIEATPVLIGPGTELDADVPSIDAFSHVITLIEQGAAGPVWLDTTLEVAPFGSLIVTERDVRALAIPASGDSRLLTTPAVTGRRTAWRTDTDGTMSAEGQLQAKVVETVSGDFEVLLRSAFRTAGRQSWQQLVANFPLARTRGGTVSDIVVSAPEDTETPFRVEYSYTLDSSVDWGKGTLWAPVAVDLRGLVVPSGTGKRNLGLVAEMIAVSRLEVPEGFDVEKTSSPPVDVAHSVARYRFTWSASGRVIQTERHFEAIVATLPQDERESYGTFTKTVREAPYSLRVRRAAPWAWNDGLTIDWRENASAAATKALDDAADISRRGDHQEAIAAVRRVIAAEPESDAAWQMLAWAQTASGSHERALHTLQGRLDSVTGPSLIKYYASRLTALGRRDEAADVLRLGRQRFPEDREFPLYLAESLVGAGRHREALDLLAGLADRQSKSARYQLMLARAHLGANQPTEAVAAFLRSAEADDSANHLNTVAWELGDRGLALDDALRLAQRSVNALSQQVNAVLVPTMGAADLRLVRSLAMVWDTLGWIHFKRGQAATGVPYLEAAWHLSHDPVIARHLVSMFEGTGDDAAAARYRALANAGSPFASARTTVPGDAPAARAMTDALGVIERALVVALPAGLGQKTPVDVLLLVATDGRVRDVRLAGAAERTLPDALRQVMIPWTPPDPQLTQVVRRGSVSCDSQGACRLRLRTSAGADAGLPW